MNKATKNCNEWKYFHPLKKVISIQVSFIGYNSVWSVYLFSLLCHLLTPHVTKQPWLIIMLAHLAQFPSPIALISLASLNIPRLTCFIHFCPAAPESTWTSTAPETWHYILGVHWFALTCPTENSTFPKKDATDRWPVDHSNSCARQVIKTILNDSKVISKSPSVGYFVDLVDHLARKKLHLLSI